MKIFPGVRKESNCTHADREIKKKIVIYSKVILIHMNRFVTLSGSILVIII